MKKLLIGLSAMVVLLLTGCTPYAAANALIIVGLFFMLLPMVIIDGFVLRWLFDGFDFNSSFEGTLLINFVSIFYAAFILSIDTVDAFVEYMVDSGLGIVALIIILLINIFIQLFVLKLAYKAVITIKGVSGIVFAHIAAVVALELMKHFSGPSVPFL